MLYVDDRIPQAALDELIAQEAIKAARPLEFNIEEA
jgi:D-3-phosphoglycerate dehydrogenase